MERIAGKVVSCDQREACSFETVGEGSHTIFSQVSTVEVVLKLLCLKIYKQKDCISIFPTNYIKINIFIFDSSQKSSAA